MGQARNRGSLEYRTNQALNKAKELMPDFLTCNHCGGKVFDLSPLSTKGMNGIDIACAGNCPSCDRVTFGVNGDTEAAEKAIKYFTDLESEGFGGGVEQTAKPTNI